MSAEGFASRSYNGPEHVAIINADRRGRFGLTKWALHDVPYKVFALGDGAVRLEPVTQEPGA